MGIKTTISVCLVKMARLINKAEKNSLALDFYLDKYEVTQVRWEEVMGFNPSKFLSPDRPVEQVTFYDVQEFAENSKGECRIPTEAEWEMAARGGMNQATYPWGNDLTPYNVKEELKVWGNDSVSYNV